MICSAILVKIIIYSLQCNPIYYIINNYENGNSCKVVNNQRLVEHIWQENTNRKANNVLQNVQDIQLNNLYNNIAAGYCMCVI